MTTHSTVIIWSPTSPADPDGATHYLVTLPAAGTAPGPLVGRITHHPGLGGVRHSARHYPTHSTTVHTPLGFGYATLDAAAAAIGAAVDATRLVALTTMPVDLPGAEPITLARHDTDTCPRQTVSVCGLVAIGDHLHCPPCGTYHVLTGAIHAYAVTVTASPATEGPGTN